MKNFNDMRKNALERAIEKEIENLYSYYEAGVRKHEWSFEYANGRIEKHLKEIRAFYEHHYERSVEES